MADDVAGDLNEEKPDEIGEQPSKGTPPPSNTEGYLKRQLAKLQKELDDRKKADMTEVDRLKAELAEERSGRTSAEERANNTLLQTRFELAARDAGVSTDALDLAFMAVDRSLLKVDENGKVVGLKAAIEKLQKDRPILFGQPRRSAGAGGGNPPGGNGGTTTGQKMNDWIRSHIR